MRDYQDAIITMYERSLRETLATLPDPTCARPAEARRIIDLLVETIAGYASGLVARELVHRVNAWFGPELAAAARAVTPPPRRAHPPAIDDDFDVDLYPRRVIDELGCALRSRLARAAADALVRIEAVAALLPADRESTAAAMFAELARTTLFDDRLTRELAFGWQCACAVIEHTPIPVVDGPPRARDLWQIWSRLASGSPPSETRQPPDRDGYIALVH